MFPIREWFSTLKEEKTADLANRIIRFIRINWQPMVAQDEARVGMSYVLACQDMTFIKNLFQNATKINITNENNTGGATALFNGHGQPITPSNRSDEFYMKEMRALNFKPLPIWEKLRNVLIAEMKKMGPIVNARSEDPTSVAKKIQDRGFIENKHEIEGLLSYVYASIGQPPFKMKEHKARFGEKHDNGNTQDFEGMGLDNMDPSDVNFFMENFHKLDEEIAVQNILDYVLSYNQWMLDIEKWVTDIIAKKAIAATCYVSDVTGAITTKYLAPETVYIYGGGNRKDFNDANAKGYERKVSIKELLDILGNKFDMEQQFNNLLLAITNTMNIEFTGIKPSYRGFVSGQERLGNNNNTASYDYNQFMSFKVTLGYIEYSSQNQETFGEVKQESGFYENNQSTTGKYPNKARWETPTYKAYYLAISQVDQILFDYGELNYQDILGASDWISNFTIVTYKDIGDPLAIQSAQIIDMINEAWYKFRYELRRAKPRGRGWNYDSMISNLMEMIPDTNTSQFNKLQKVMEMLDSSANEIYTWPVGKDGKQVLIPGNQLNYDIPNGMSKESMLWWEIMMNGIQYLSDMIGIAPLREGDPGNARDSMNNQFKALEYSQSATYYIPDMLTYMFQQLSVKSAFYAQDVILYKEYNSIAYKFLQDAIGDETLDKLEKLGKTGLHRFGIFIESLNQGPLRQKMDAIMADAIKTKSITTAQYLLINDIKSTKKAFITFAYFEQRNIKLAQKQQQQAAQQQQQLQQQQAQQIFELEKMKGDYMIEGKQIESETQKQVHITNQMGGITKAAMKHESDVTQIEAQAQADLKTQSALLDATGKQNPAPPAPPPPQQMGNTQNSLANIPQPGQQQQLRDNVVPGATNSAPAV